MQVIQALIRKIIMFIYLQIFVSIVRLRVYMMEKIQGLVSIYYQMQNNNSLLLQRLSDRHTFLDPYLDKV